VFDNESEAAFDGDVTEKQGEVISKSPFMYIGGLEAPFLGAEGGLLVGWRGRRLG
jgi:hypothetical protein